MQELDNSERLIKLNWWQNELLRDYDSDVLAVTAGYGSGKTLASVLWVHDRLSYNPGCDALYIEPTYPLIKRVAMPAWEEAMSMLGLKLGIHYDIYSSADNPRVKYHVTGQTVYFLSGERPESIVGITTAAIAVIDEAGLCKEDVFKKVRARIRYKKARKCQILCPGTPEGLNWYSETFDSDTMEKWHQESCEQDMVKYISTEELDGTISVQRHRRFRATVYSNKHNLAPSYIPNLLDAWKYNQNYKDSYIYGYFRPFATGLAYSNYKSPVHKIAPIKPDRYKTIHLTWDYNICPQWVSIQKQHEFTKFGGKKTFWSAIENSNAGNEDLEGAVIEFAVKHPRELFKNTPILIYGDASGHSKSHKAKGSDYKNIVKILKRLGYNRVEVCAIKSNPLERTSVDYVQEELADDRFRICSNCDMVLKSITRTVWSNDERAKLDKPPGEHWTHPMDAVKYFFCAMKAQSSRKLISGRY